MIGVHYVAKVVQGLQVGEVTEIDTFFLLLSVFRLDCYKRITTVQEMHTRMLIA